MHRRDGLEAVHFAIDELKASGSWGSLLIEWVFGLDRDANATVPVWKKEFYEDGSVWKGNAECRHHERRQALEETK